jgi:hypothetical protein
LLSLLTICFFSFFFMSTDLHGLEGTEGNGGAAKEKKSGSQLRRGTSERRPSRSESMSMGSSRDREREKEKTTSHDRKRERGVKGEEDGGGSGSGSKISGGSSNSEQQNGSSANHWAYEGATDGAATNGQNSKEQDPEEQARLNAKFDRYGFPKRDERCAHLHPLKSLHATAIFLMLTIACFLLSLSFHVQGGGL